MSAVGGLASEATSVAQEKKDDRPGAPTRPISASFHKPDRPLERDATFSHGRLLVPAHPSLDLEHVKRGESICPISYYGTCGDSLRFVPAAQFLGHVSPSVHPYLRISRLPFVRNQADHRTFRVLSYNIMAQCNAVAALSYCVPSALVWEKRKEMIIRELVAYRAHIVCLQGGVTVTLRPLYADTCSSPD